MNRTKIALFLFIFVSIACTVAQIVVSTAFATDGIAYGTLQTQADQLDRENIELKEHIYTLSSLTAIAQRATTMGFAFDKKANLTITAPLPFAMRQ